MDVVKKTDEYTIFKKKSGRFGVRGKNKTWINGDEKIKILVKEGLIKAPTAKPKEEVPSSPNDENVSPEPDSDSSSSDSKAADEATAQEEATS